MPFIDLRKFPLSEFPYHTHNSLSVPVFTSCTLLIYPISESTISTIISIPKHHFIPLESTLLLYNQEKHVFLHLDPSSLPSFSGSSDCSTYIPQVSLCIFITSLRIIFFLVPFIFLYKSEVHCLLTQVHCSHCPRTFCMDDRV